MKRQPMAFDDTRASRRLLRALLAACTLLFVIAAIGLTLALTARVRDQALANEQRELVSFAQSLVVPTVRDGQRITVQPSEARRIRAVAALSPDVSRVEVWRRDARRVWASGGARGLARADRARPELLTALSLGRVTRSALGDDGLYAVITPIRAKGAIVGAAVVYADGNQIETLVADARQAIIATLAAVFSCVLVALLIVSVVLGRRLRQQGDALGESSHELVESYRELERSSMEAIETLNATVEAKDPYTAGHSQRVRRISLALGRELSLSPKRLGALAEAALFHDVGKIGVPDDILTKPGRLTAVEFEIMKQHAPKGAEIVGKLSRLQGAVPAIRHHHERWDGCGYPDGISEQSIPLEAAIIGLADAWDAMTTQRPYRVALPVHDALSEIRSGRGTQFNPAVVDAFLDIAARRPSEVLPHGTTLPPLAAVS